MSVAGVLGKALEMVAKHSDLIELALYAVETGGVDPEDLKRVIKDKMTLAANERMRRELGR
jgi:hypothetical protein